MYIQTEETPNPLALKFLPAQVILEEGTIYIADKTEISKSPLAAILFEIKGVESIFFGSDFITVTKSQDSDWQVLKPQLLSIIMDYLVAGKPISSDDNEQNPSNNNKINEDDSEVVKQIKEISDTRVRPAVAVDGGDIIFHKFEDGVVYLEMHGACSGCPSSTATLKDGIENMLKHYLPEVQSVEPYAA